MESATFPSLSRVRAATVGAAAAGLLLVALSACTPSSQEAQHVLPSAGIHGMAVNSDTGRALLATRDGLVDVSRTPVSKIGPTNDLTGFTAALNEGVFYASGHPGPGSSLPDPLGLIRSSDGGATWEQLSRQGESDFHSLTTTKSGIVAYDGTLRTSPDGKTWKTVATGFTPAALAGTPYSNTVLAPTSGGLQRSTDGGATWALKTSAPVIQFAAFADASQAVGVEPDGTIHYSSDAGATWSRKGRINHGVQAIAAKNSPNGPLWIWAATGTGILVSTDRGDTFQPFGSDGPPGPAGEQSPQP